MTFDVTNTLIFCYHQRRINIAVVPFLYYYELRINIAVAPFLYCYQRRYGFPFQRFSIEQKIITHRYLDWVLQIESRIHQKLTTKNLVQDWTS